jgi:hypothetical protein
MADCNVPMPSRARVAEAVAAASACTGIPVAVILDPTRRQAPAVSARWLAWRRLHEVDGFGFAPIARVWGCDHTTIINARDQGWTPTKRPGRPPRLIGPAIAASV